MAASRMSAESGALVLRCVPTLRNMRDDEFFELCQRNRDLRIERTQDGDLVIMPPTGSEAGRLDAVFNAVLTNWALADGTGIAFSSSSGFTLPSGAVRSPDAAWIERSRWASVPAESREKFAPLCPDFVVEIRSPSDVVADLQAKMQEYMANGARLGWLIDPVGRKLFIYSGSGPLRIIDDPQVISAGAPLSGFSVDFPMLWRRV